MVSNTSTAASAAPVSLLDNVKGYLIAEQQLSVSKEEAEKQSNQSFFFRYRKPIAMFLPAFFVHLVWWSVMFSNDYFFLFTEESGSLEKPRWLMSVTMIFGSMVAGATSEGGGAVAFPVMTLALGVPPPVARDFSFMIQSIGMTSGSFTILFMRLQLEWNAIKWVSLGGVAGIIFGLEKVAPRLSPPYSKMYFVVIWSAFAIGLYLVNRNRDRKVYDEIQGWEEAVIWRYNDWINLNYKRECLLAFGFLGGIFSAMAGSGIDICSFACLTLLFRVSEKVATPTSVLLMACNTVVGFAYRQFAMGGVEADAWRYFAVCIPVVCLGAPFGALIGSYASRLALAGVIYVIDSVQLIGALVVIQPWTYNKTDTPLHLCVTSTLIFIGGLVFFSLISYLGLKQIPADDEIVEVKVEDGPSRRSRFRGVAEDTGDSSSDDLSRDFSDAGANHPIHFDDITEFSV